MIIVNYYLSYYVLWLSYPKKTLSAGYFTRGLTQTAVLGFLYKRVDLIR